MSTYNNYGLSGRGADDYHDEYDHFLCFGKKCKQRKKEKHEARIAKRKAKVDARKADTERIRAESNVLQSTMSPTPSTPIATMPLTQQNITNPQQLGNGVNQGVPTTQRAGFGGNTIMLVIGALLVVGYFYQKNKKGGKVQATPALSANQ